MAHSKTKTCYIDLHWKYKHNSLFCQTSQHTLKKDLQNSSLVVGTWPLGGHSPQVRVIAWLLVHPKIVDANGGEIQKQNFVRYLNEPDKSLLQVKPCTESSCHSINPFAVFFWMRFPLSSPELSAVSCCFLIFISSLYRPVQSLSSFYEDIWSQVLWTFFSLQSCLSWRHKTRHLLCRSILSVEPWSLFVHKEAKKKEKPEKRFQSTISLAQQFTLLVGMFSLKNGPISC